MIIEHQGQALTVAMEMERRAIRTYERALLLAKDEEVRKGIEDILGDERRHLKRFTEMWDKTVNSAEQQVLLQAMAAWTSSPGTTRSCPPWARCGASAAALS